MTNDELIAKAASLIKAKKIGSFTVADVGCALITDRGNVYTGVCIDTSSGMGFCAEHTAIGSMITAGEYRIKSIVAVWKDENEDVYVLAPCGRCREFMYKTNKENLGQGGNSGQRQSHEAEGSAALLRLVPQRCELLKRVGMTRQGYASYNDVAWRLPSRLGIVSSAAR